MCYTEVVFMNLYAEVSIDDQNHVLIFFNEPGKFLNAINRRGQGPEEYSMMFNALVDWDKEEVFVFDSANKIMVYSLDGTFKRKLSFDLHLGQHDAYIWSDGQLISYQNGNRYHRSRGYSVSRSVSRCIFFDRICYHRSWLCSNRSLPHTYDPLCFWRR